MSISEIKDQNWKAEFEALIPYLGHRNWTLVVDKAFPIMSPAGFITLNTHDTVPNVARYVLETVNRAEHLNPKIYSDKEFEYLTDSLKENVEKLRTEYKLISEKFPFNAIWHETIFPKIAEVAQQFKVVILKTETTIPYSSLFIEFDCGYWSRKSEAELREIIKKG